VKLNVLYKGLPNMECATKSLIY